MSLPNPGMDFTPFNTLPAASLDDLVENIEALADGSGQDNSSVTPDKLSNSSGSNSVATTDTQTATSYGPMGSAGPTVTVTVGVKGILDISMAANMSNSAGNNNFMSFALSGANTAAPSNADSLSSFGTGQFNMGITRRITGLTPGLTTITAQYRVSGGIGTFSNRQIIVEPK